MVGCPPTQVPEQAELFTYLDYPEQWAFNTHRHKGRLVSDGVGTSAAYKGKMYEVRLRFIGKKWKCEYLRDYEDPHTLAPLEVEDEMYKEFAHHKARHLHQKEQRQLQGEMKRSLRKMN